VQQFILACGFKFTSICKISKLKKKNLPQNLQEVAFVQPNWQCGCGEFTPMSEHETSLFYRT
jgi:hypothetical protein